MSENINNRFTAKQIEQLKKDFVPKPLVLKRVKNGKVYKKELPLKFSPASWKQDQFRKSTVDILIYGGSLGGGKTHNGLAKLLLGVSDPNFRAMIIRKQMNVMTRSGGIVDEAKKLYREFNEKVKFNNTKNFFRWPSGAETAFTQVATDEDAEGLRGAQWSMVLCDEATELDESHVFQIQSRIRSDAVDTKTPRQLILTCNPNPDSYLRQWVDWWLIPEGKENAGRPDPEKECAIRYFVRIDGVMHWADDPQELIKRYPSDDPDNPTRPVSVQFVAASIFDNPPLLKNNPNYLSNLRSLPKVKQERDLYGRQTIAA